MDYRLPLMADLEKTLHEEFHDAVASYHADLDHEYDNFHKQLGSLSSQYQACLTSWYDETTESLESLTREMKHLDLPDVVSPSTTGRFNNDATDPDAMDPDDRELAIEHDTLENILRAELRYRAHRFKKVILGLLRTLRYEWEQTIIQSFLSGDLRDRDNDAVVTGDLEGALLDSVHRTVEDMRLATEKTHRDTLETWLYIVQF
jgi:hypothetical protein